MAVTDDDILERYTERKAATGIIHQRMREVRDVYNADVVVPLPELERNERPAIANLTAMGLDQMGTRIASVMPTVEFPTRRDSESARKAAADKRRAVYGWWDANRMHLKMYQRARRFLGYGQAPVLVRPDFARGIPRWELKDPLGVYPAPNFDLTDPCVEDAIFAVKRSLKWLRTYYPEQIRLLRMDRNPPATTQFDVLEYVDDNELVCVVIGPDVANGNDNHEFTSLDTVTAGSRVVRLERVDNRAGRCLAVVPGRINLDRRQGQFDSSLGMHMLQARLMALEVIAVERGIFPDEWLIPDQVGSTPQIDVEANGRMGVVGVVRGGTLRQQALNPGFQTYPTVDRIERAQRLNGGIPAEFGGESQSNVRTGRRGENILASTIDFPIQEAQQIFAASLEAENAIAIAVDKGYHNTAKSFYVSWAGAQGHVDYTPSKLFDTEENIVSYAHAGADANGMAIAGLQRNGAGTLSKLSFMRMDPMVQDPEFEHDQILIEGLEAAYLSSTQARAANGELPEVDYLRVVELIRRDYPGDLAGAVRKAQEEAQERQAAELPPGDPGLMPGMANPGAGAEAIPAIGPPQPSLENLSMALRDLRNPQRLSPAERPRPEALV